MYLDITELSDEELELLHIQNQKEDLPCFLPSYYEPQGSIFQIIDKKWINKLIITKEMTRRADR